MSAPCMSLLFCYHTDLLQSLLLPHWPVHAFTDLSQSTVTTLTSTITTDLHMSVLLTLTCICLYCYHTVHVCPIITDMCISLLLSFWPVHVSSVTTLTCISPYCYHTDLYLSVLWPHRLPVPVYCYHTDLSQSLLLPHWHVPVSIVNTDLYLSTDLKVIHTCLLLPHWHVHVSTLPH